MKIKVKIIKPKLDDLIEIIDLWKKQYNFHHHLDPEYYVSNSASLIKKFQKYLAEAIEKNNPHILVARTDGKIIGFVTFNRQSADYFDTKIQEYGEVIELFIDDGYRNQGIGKRLLQAVENHFSKLRIKYIEIQTSTFNNNAIEFYQHSGYINRQTLLFKKIKETTVLEFRDKPRK